jgi:hypothetical protein
LSAEAKIHSFIWSMETLLRFQPRQWSALFLGVPLERQPDRQCPVPVIIRF